MVRWYWYFNDHWVYKIKDLNVEKVTGSSCEEKTCWVNY